MITGIHHTGLVVRDLDAGIAFFAAGADFAVVSRFDVADTPGKRALLQVADATGRAALLRGTLGCIELFEFAATAGAEPRRPDIFEAGIRHICIQGALDDVLFDRMIAVGASGHARPSGLGTGNLYAYIRDPEDNVIEVEGVPWTPPGVTRAWYAHTAIVTPDIDRLSEFYAMVTGAPVHRRGTFGPDHKFDRVGGFTDARFHGAWLRTGNAELEFWQYVVPPTEPAPRRVMSAPGWNHLCFETGDIDADVARLHGAGVELHAPAEETGTARIAFFRDPDGNVFELLEPQAGAITVAALTAEGDAPALRAARDAHSAPRSATG